MDMSLAHQLNIPLHSFNQPIAVLEISEESVPIGRITYCSGPVSLQVGVLYSATLTFMILPSSQNPIILGLPWLQDLDPGISWASGELISWSPRCLSRCCSISYRALKVEIPQPEDLSTIPDTY